METTSCSNCLKESTLCVCSEIRPISTQLHVLILQHPQEPDKDLGSARLAHLALPNSTLKIGLSWRNLAHALGREADPKRWAVLYLGSGIRGQTRRNVVLVDKGGKPLEDQDSIQNNLQGIVVLDGTWSQAKTLWWRNAWLLKLRRAILIPREPSLYRELRREPRRECVSTLESIGLSLAGLGEKQPVAEELKRLFGQLLDRQRSNLARRRSTKVSAS